MSPLFLTFLFLITNAGAAHAADGQMILFRKFGLRIDYITQRLPRTDPEQKGQALLNSPLPIAPVRVYIEFLRSPSHVDPNQLMIIPDVHGTPPPVRAMWWFMNNMDFEWLALEMIPSSMQKEVDAYLTESPESARFKVAESTLFYETSIAWENHWHVQFELANSPYMNTLKQAKSKGIKVYGMGTDFRGTDALAIASRNIEWAGAIPKRGKGLIFGGAQHFLSSGGINVQDILYQRGQTEIKAFNPGIRMLVERKFGSQIEADDFKISLIPDESPCDVIKGF